MTGSSVTCTLFVIGVAPMVLVLIHMVVAGLCLVFFSKLINRVELLGSQHFDNWATSFNLRLVNGHSRVSMSFALPILHFMLSMATRLASFPLVPLLLEGCFGLKRLNILKATAVVYIAGCQASLLIS